MRFGNGGRSSDLEDNRGGSGGGGGRVVGLGGSAVLLVLSLLFGRNLFTDAGVEDVAVRAVDVPTMFRDFDDYWSPYLGGQGPAPGYATSLSKERRAVLRERIRADLPISADGSIQLSARAWAVRGRRN